MKRGQTDHERTREIEQRTSVTVIDLADRGEPCETCGARQLVFYVHCWRERQRPIAALCKPCTEARAGGAERVWVTRNRGPGLKTRWRAGERVALRSAAQLAGLTAGRAKGPQKEPAAQVGHAVQINGEDFAEGKG